eukprot:TRINITY_DN7201_c0_g1_i3.p1 TRINITY_DN7201_c0_g1~~TRINITY_DN7201_c0_g1_i3.p1  ORF type:complete len:118 (-),score=25.31 TRINITY_DN7201_c0_g1_i3:42-395(-)
MKVPDSRYWHLQVKTLAQCHRWEELEKLAPKKNSSPIGFLPFVESCVEQKNLAEAAKYILKLPEAEQQMEWFCNIGFFKEAAEVAIQNRDVESLQKIRAQCKTPSVLSFIDAALSRQ